METDEGTRMALLKSVYEQHWLHVRHVENERLWFTNIFGVIVAALIAVRLWSGEQAAPDWYAVFAGFFISGLALAGYVFCLVWRPPFVEHSTLANRMLTDKQLGRYAPYLSTHYERLKSYKWLGWLSAHELFLYFYALMTSGGLAVALGLGLQWDYWWTCSFVPALVLGSLWRVRLTGRETTYRNAMRTDGQLAVFRKGEDSLETYEGDDILRRGIRRRFKHDLEGLSLHDAEVMPLLQPGHRHTTLSEAVLLLEGKIAACHWDENGTVNVDSLTARGDMVVFPSSLAHALFVQRDSRIVVTRFSPPGQLWDEGERIAVDLPGKLGALRDRWLESPEAHGDLMTEIEQELERLRRESASQE